jgi:hypothetical protein
MEPKMGNRREAMKIQEVSLAFWINANQDRLDPKIDIIQEVVAKMDACLENMEACSMLFLWGLPKHLFCFSASIL